MWTTKDTLMAMLSLSLIGGIGYGLFFAGKMVERRAYTAVFAKQVETAYYQGYGDGQKTSYDVGYAKGAEYGYKKCLNEDYKVKDEY